jgi:hypothetical protein
MLRWLEGIGWDEIPNFRYEAPKFLDKRVAGGCNSSSHKQLQSLNNRLSYDFRAGQCG